MKRKETEQLNKSLKALSVKVILLGVTLLLLLSSIIYLTVAWYTKMVSVSGLKFQAAKWDFSANFAVDGIKINVYEYSTLTKDRAAPGTGGVIPLKLAASQSDTDVSYAISINRDAMSDEFKARIFFYYLDANNNRVYLSGSPTDSESYNILTGTIKRSEDVDLSIYWEWIYEAPAGYSIEQQKAWDEFDTEVGKNPELYSKYMNAEISIIGHEVQPVRETAAPAA